MWPLNEYLFYVQIQAAKPVYSDSSLDKLWWSCSAWPIESLETSYGSLDLYIKYTFSWEATSTSPFDLENSELCKMFTVQMYSKIMCTYIVRTYYLYYISLSPFYFSVISQCNTSIEKSFTWTLLVTYNKEIPLTFSTLCLKWIGAKCMVGIIITIHFTRQIFLRCCSMLLVCK